MRTKPERPEGFPLRPHNSGQWTKSIRGKDYYFGNWDDPDTALLRYHKLLDELGVTKPRGLPRSATVGTTVGKSVVVKRSAPGPRVAGEKSEPTAKPDKPYAGFPLYAHGNGQWAKTIHGRAHYFGPWANHDAALKEFNRVQTSLYAGNARPAVDNSEGLKAFCARFLDYKQDASKEGRNKPDTYKEYRRTSIEVCKILGDSTPIRSLTHEDFDKLRKRLAERYPNPVTLRNNIVRARVLFNWAYKSRTVPHRLPIDLALPRVAESQLRKEKETKRMQGKTMFDAAEIRHLIESAQSHRYMRPAILLGINAALGPRDLCELEWSFIDFQTGMLDFPRPKSWIRRQALLWPETLEALKAWREISPQSVNVCCGVKGQALGQTSNATPIPHRFDTVMKNAVIDHEERAGKLKKIQGRGFYCLRHSFETIASGTNDQIAVNLVMGHADHTIASVYRERIEQSRLERVANIVHAWLWPC